MLECLTARERQIVDLFAQGLSSREIARDLGISYATVRSHATAIYRKLEIGSRSELLILYMAGKMEGLQQELDNAQKKLRLYEAIAERGIKW